MSLPVINGYSVKTAFSTAGGGQSRWAFATRGGREYFLKEFICVRYPVPGSPGSPAVKAKKRLKCGEFEKRHLKIMAALRGRCLPGGNLIYAEDFFRFGSAYYKATERVNMESLSVAEVARLPVADQMLLLKTISHSLGLLHALDIVHGDLKPDNILIKKTTRGSCVAKLIDFDESYFTRQPPEELIGTLEYLSAESHAYIRAESKDPGTLTPKADVFSIGLIFHEYLTGRKPLFNARLYKYAADACLAGDKLSVHASLNPQLKDLIHRMLNARASGRPTVSEALAALQETGASPELPAKPPVVTPKTPPPGPSSRREGRLIINMNKRSK